MDDRGRALVALRPRDAARAPQAAGDPPALEDRDDIDSTYWGGALFALLADVRIRAATANARSLDDVVRAVLVAGGRRDATARAWRTSAIGG